MFGDDLLKDENGEYDPDALISELRAMACHEPNHASLLARACTVLAEQHRLSHMDRIIGLARARIGACEDQIREAEDRLSEALEFLRKMDGAVDPLNAPSRNHDAR
ncbi:MAG: hypothetical protein IPN84_05720 [Sphingomonadales bacterium]|nr:hypothetical protein [Sphingomonadales bacterium]